MKASKLKCQSLAQYASVASMKYARIQISLSGGGQAGQLITVGYGEQVLVCIALLCGIVHSAIPRGLYNYKSQKAKDERSVLQRSGLNEISKLVCPSSCTLVIHTQNKITYPLLGITFEVTMETK